MVFGKGAIIFQRKQKQIKIFLEVEPYIAHISHISMTEHHSLSDSHLQNRVYRLVKINKVFMGLPMPCHHIHTIQTICIVKCADCVYIVVSPLRSYVHAFLWNYMYLPRITYFFSVKLCILRIYLH